MAYKLEFALKGLDITTEKQRDVLIFIPTRVINRNNHDTFVEDQDCVLHTKSPSVTTKLHHSKGSHRKVRKTRQYRDELKKRPQPIVCNLPIGGLFRENFNKESLSIISGREIGKHQT